MSAADYALFGIRYLVIPSGSTPPVAARLDLRAGPYALWTLASAGSVVHPGTIVGQLPANRSDIGKRSIPVLNSRLAQASDYVRVAYGQRGGRERPLPRPSPAPPAGTVAAQSDRLEEGLVAASVRMRRAGVVALSASFDPGWTATVDGHPAATEMVAPALVATTVPAGAHQIVFRYRGRADYLLLFGAGAGALVALGCTDVRRRAIRRLSEW